MVNAQGDKSKNEQLNESQLENLENFLVKINYTLGDLFREGEIDIYSHISVDENELPTINQKLRKGIQYLSKKFNLDWVISKIAYDLYLKFEKTISQGQAEAVIRRVIGLRLSSTARSQLYELRKKIQRYKRFLTFFEEWGVKFDFTLKIILFGLDVPLKHELITPVFRTQPYSPRIIGVEFLLTERNVLENTLVKLHIWNMSGDNMFNSIRPNYYKGSCGAIFVYDNNNPESFEKINLYFSELKGATDLKFKLKKKSKISVEMPRILIETGESNLVSWKEGQSLAESIGAHYFKMSNFNEVLTFLTLQIITRAQPTK
jgi:GTPase SAR1 family protein